MTMTMRRADEVFGFGGDTMVPCGPRSNIPKDTRWHWSASALRDHLTFLHSGKRSMKLHGPMGSGKTGGVEQFHAASGRRLSSLNCHKGTGEEALFGQLVPDPNGRGLKFAYGVVAQAAKDNHPVLLNEFNALPAGVSIMLNDIAQSGSSFIIPLTGEEIRPGGEFRIYTTVNPAGSIYNGRKDQDASTMDRFFHSYVDYPEPEVEIKILTDVWMIWTKGDKLKSYETAWHMVKVAHTVRNQSMERSNASDALPTTLSTRALVNWATYWGMLQRHHAAIHRGLERALTNCCEEPVREAIHSIVGTVFPSAPRYEWEPKALRTTSSSFFDTALSERQSSL